MDLENKSLHDWKIYHNNILQYIGKKQKKKTKMITVQARKNFETKKESGGKLSFWIRKWGRAHFVLFYIQTQYKLLTESFLSLEEDWTGTVGPWLLFD